MAAWLCIAGGILWGLKPLYDWLVIGRQMNMGYQASDWSDYIKFAFPFLCLGGVYVLYTLYGKKLQKSLAILALALICNGLFHFFEIYYPDSGIPFGLLFLFSGTVLLVIGALVMVLQLLKNKEIPRSLFRLASALFGVSLLFCVSPFLTGVFSEQVYTVLLISIMMAIGFVWAAIGGVVLRMIGRKELSKKKNIETDQKTQL